MIRSKLLTISGGGDVYIGEKEFRTPGQYPWAVPLTVTRIHVCCIGAGGFNDYAVSGQYEGGGGGGLVWANDIEVTPGEVLLIQVGSPQIDNSSEQGDSIVGKYDEDTSGFTSKLITANGGERIFAGGFDLHGQQGDGYSGGVGSNVGYAGNGEIWGGSGGGAGGYLGAGGDGSVTLDGSGTNNEGTGGSAAGGFAYWRTLQGLVAGFKQGAGGGGVGLKGQGASGQAVNWPASDTVPPLRGNAGSGGTLESFGGGGACLYNQSPESAPDYARPGDGAVRIIWGIKYSYPNNADVSQ